jgi:hypothetical protein
MELFVRIQCGILLKNNISKGVGLSDPQVFAVLKFASIEALSNQHHEIRKIAASMTSALFCRINAVRLPHPELTATD